jgi:hypothetical protein
MSEARPQDRPDRQVARGADIEHPMHAVGRHEKPITGGKRFLKHVHLGPRSTADALVSTCRMGDIPAG